MLLARQPVWPEGRFSVLAGFVEAGESLEACVLREIHEEVGVHVRDVAYLGSQAWPFPRSLMVGFQAVADPDAPLRPADGEIAEAMWVTRAELREALASGRLGRRAEAPAAAAGPVDRPQHAGELGGRGLARLSPPRGAHAHRAVVTHIAGGVCELRTVCVSGSCPQRARIGLTGCCDGGSLARCCRLRARMLAAGFSDDEVRRLLRIGDLSRVRRGAYVVGPLPEEPVRRHRLAITGAVRELADEAVVSHVSAAVVHGLPLWKVPLERVHVTRARASGGRRGRIVHVHVAPLHVDEIAMVDGVVVTSMARTVVDIARTVPFEQAVVVADAALARGIVDGPALAEALLRTIGWRGAPAARRAVAFADPGARASASRAAGWRSCGRACPAGAPVGGHPTGPATSSAAPTSAGLTWAPSASSTARSSTAALAAGAVAG